MTHAPSPANYQYIYERLLGHYGDNLPSLTILDFGCGMGGLVAYLREKKLNIVGADPYEGIYDVWQNDTEGLHRIENRRLPFTDAHFDCVISNQVFEHIADYKPELAEVRRVLKQDGLFFALFPTLETAYEVHSGIWFAYYFKFCPPLLRAWLYIWRTLGAGLWKEKFPKDEWVKTIADVIIDDCHYKCIVKILDDWKQTFGHKPNTYMAEYLDFRLQHSRFAKIARYIPAPAMAFITLVRAGIVIETRK